MEDKSSADRPIEEKPGQESNMESDEVMSGGASVTENKDSTNKEADEEPSQSQSEPTSGIEISSGSASEIPCERVTSDGGERKPESSPLPSESTSGIEIISRSSTSASEIPCEVVETSDTENKPKTSPVPAEPTVELGSGCTSASESRSEDVSATNIETDANVPSTPTKKSIFGKAYSSVKGLLSPPKSGKSKPDRSKSMSPKKNQPTDSDNSKPVSEEPSVSPESEAISKKGSENDGMLQRLKKKFDKLKMVSKPSSESENLISNEETGRTERRRSSKLDNLPEPIWSDLCTCKPQWTDNKSSLTDPTFDGTTMSDIPSTCSGGDVFPSDSSKEPSEIGENISEEAVAGSLVSSPGEVITDIQKEKSECIKSDCPSIDNETQNVVVEHLKENLSTAEDGPSTDQDSVNELAENSEESMSAAKEGAFTEADIKNVVAVENVKENPASAKDSSTDDETKNEVVAEKPTTEKDSESQEDEGKPES